MRSRIIESGDGGVKKINRYCASFQGENMSQDMAVRIRGNPKFRYLIRTRNIYAVTMTLLVIVVYFGYILLVAFDKSLLAQKIGTGMATSIGIPLGLGVILFTIAITAVYVHLANTRFDALAAEVLREANE